MVKYLLDTCIIISFFRGDKSLQSKILAAGIQNCAISELTLAELYIGPYRILHSPASRIDAKEKARMQLQSIELLSETFKILPVTNFAPKFADVHEMLRAKGEPLEDFDLLIGTFASANKMTLVTRNKKHFDKIPDLKYEIW